MYTLTVNSKALAAENVLNLCLLLFKGKQSS